ncbi:MAG: hypothetical protein IJ415_02020, partial [Clostridia bacterium]|nr:hypothetical protein [Clostridia bacterium]
MTNEDIKNSTTLIGPSCVGKSLLANELSKKLNMNYVCIDDLLVMIGYEQSGNLSQNKKVQQKFIRQCAEEIINDPSSAVYLRNPRYRKKQIELIKDFVKLYNYYANMFGGL